ncbi:hypothetical protein V1505DRAFT_286181, partial [Lipomyces doorenjongii]
IRLRRTIAGTPSKDLVAERMDRTLLDKEGSIRAHAGVPPMFWSLSILLAAHLPNISP